MHFELRIVADNTSDLKRLQDYLAVLVAENEKDSFSSAEAEDAADEPVKEKPAKKKKKKAEDEKPKKKKEVEPEPEDEDEESDESEDEDEDEDEKPKKKKKKGDDEKPKKKKKKEVEPEPEDEGEESDDEDESEDEDEDEGLSYEKDIAPLIKKVSAQSNGFAKVKEIFGEFGAKKGTDVPKAKYESLAKKLKKALK